MYLAYSQLTYLDFESLDALFPGFPVLPVDAGPSPAKGGERAGRRTVDTSTTKGSSGQVTRAFPLYAIERAVPTGDRSPQPTTDGNLGACATVAC